MKNLPYWPWLALLVFLLGVILVRFSSGSLVAPVRLWWPVDGLQAGQNDSQRGISLEAY